jgi:RNA polymerase sigma-70 factor (ECF subfamily)
MTNPIRNVADCPIIEAQREIPDAQASAEARLVERVRAGDPNAWETLVRCHSGRLLAVARRFLRTEEDRVDAVQDAFLSAFRSLDGFKGNATLGTWLHRILVNACLQKLRTRSRMREVPMDDLLPTLDETGHSNWPARPWEEEALGRLTRTETRQRVRECINQLPKTHREVLLLRDIEELDTDQSAQLLGISPGAVKVRLHRARQALRSLLEPLALGEREA